VLIKALEQGKWLVLDNANLCSASVLDRLNSLLEPNGFLSINEHCGPDGEPKIVKPHPNFRIFLTMDARFGELSRAMRNRAVEIYLEPFVVNQDLHLNCSSETEPSLHRFRNVERVMDKTVSNSEETQMLQVVAFDNLSMADMPLLARFSSAMQSLVTPDSGKDILPVFKAFLNIVQNPLNMSCCNALLHLYQESGGRKIQDAQVSARDDLLVK
jgi:midasin